MTGCTLLTNSLALRTARNSSIAIFFLQNSSHAFEQLWVIRSACSTKGYTSHGRELLDRDCSIRKRVRHQSSINMRVLRDPRWEDFTIDTNDGQLEQSLPH